MKTVFQIFFLFCFSLLLLTKKINGQLKITGTVYNSTGLHPLEAASVESSSGTGMATDKNGHYEISVNEKDSIWFSYLGKATMKFPVTEVMNYPQFDISLHVGVPVLKEVKIRPRYYWLDSIQNRIDYAKGFNYQKPSLKSIVRAFYIIYIAIDIDELIRAFQKKKIRSMMSFKRRLLQEERDKFIDHRFTKPLVRNLTGIDGNHLDSFMLNHRPQYEFTLSASDYDFQEYIIQAYKKYRELIGLKKEE